MQIIKNRQLTSDDWRHVQDAEALPAAGDVIVSLARWQSEHDVLAGHDGQVGVRLASSDELGPLVADPAALAKIPVIALEFPKFTDGRAYTKARLLRERYAYTGELRAVGYVLRDQLFYMERCGINAFELKPGKPIESALEAFAEYSVTYQGAADDPRPLFRRVDRR